MHCSYAQLRCNRARRFLSAATDVHARARLYALIELGARARTATRVHIIISIVYRPTWLYVDIRFSIRHFLLVVHWNRAYISHRFQDIQPQIRVHNITVEVAVVVSDGQKLTLKELTFS